jgi:hypothetical protein
VKINGFTFESRAADVRWMGSGIGCKAILDYLAKRKIAKGMNDFVFRGVEVRCRSLFENSVTALSCSSCPYHLLGHAVLREAATL